MPYQQVSDSLTVNQAQFEISTDCLLGGAALGAF
jgi:hypothetical protein